MAEQRSDPPSEPGGERPEPPPAAKPDWLRAVARAAETVAPLVARQAPKPEQIPTDRRGRWATLLAIVGILITVLQFLLGFFDLVTRPLEPLSEALPYLAATLFAVAGIYAVYAAVRARTRRQRLASLGLAGTILVIGVTWGGWLLYDSLRPPSGYRILISEFDGATASQRIDFARRIAENLRTQLAGSGMPIEIRRTTEHYADAETALAQGRRQQAGLVIWGWYDDQGVSPHIEVLEMPGAPTRSGALPIAFARAEASGTGAHGSPLDATLAKVASVARTPAALPDLTLFAEHGPDQIAFVAGAVLGLGMLANGQDDQARTLFDQALAAVADDPSAEGREIIYYQRALLNYQLGDLRAAKADLETALQLRPAFPEAHTLLAELLTGFCDPALDLPRARAAAEEAAALQPDNAATHSLVAELALQSGDVERARRAAEEAQRLAPDAPEMYETLAAVYAAQGLADEAAAARARSLALRQQAVAAPAGATVDNLLALGGAYLAVDDYAPAQAAYARAAELAPQDPRTERGIVSVLYWSGDLEAALAAATAGAARAPADSYWPVLTGIIAGQLGREEEALAALQQAAQVATCDPAPHLLLGSAYFQRGDIPAARASYDHALAIAPDDQTARYAAGAAALADGDYAAAVEAFETLAAQMPAAVDIHYWLGNAYAGSGDAAKARAVYEKVIELSAGRTPTVHLAYAYDELDRYDEAIATYIKLLAAAESPDLHTYLGAIYVEKEIPDLAAAEFNRALELQPEHLLALQALGKLQYEQGDLAAAAATLERYLALDNTAEMQFTLGVALRNLGDLAGAYRHFQEADRLKPQEPATTYQLGATATWLGRLDEASAYLDLAQRLLPQNSDINLTRATVAQKRCEPAEAIAELERAVTIAPENSLLRGILAGSYLAAGQPERAEPLIDALVAAPAGEAAVHWLAGILLTPRRQASSAEEQLLTAITAAQANPGVLALAQTALGQLYWQEGNTAGAAEAFAAALAADPAQAEAAAGLGILALQKGASAEALAHFDAAADALGTYGPRYSYDGATLLAPILELYRALALAQAGDAAASSARQQGLAALDAILQQTPDWPNARLIEGMFATAAGDSRAAGAAYTRAIGCDATLESAREQFERLAGEVRGD